MDQPKPCIGSDLFCPCQDGDACHYVKYPWSDEPAMEIPYHGVFGQAREWLIKHNARRGENGWIAG